jgi:peptidoglycan/LPS O-acetylase OafA/YrhL
MVEVTPAVGGAGDDAPEMSRARRLDFLDACRGIAALAVVFQHGAENHWRAGKWAAAHVTQFGQLGVTLFFLCSGFIIPVSIERGTLRSFWIRRFFRLYPMFWISLLAAYLLWHADRLWIPPELGDHLWQGIAANATMLARPLGQPYVMGLYWTLTIEMAFYVGCSILFRWRLLHRSVELAYLAMAVTLLSNAALTVLDRPTKLFFYPFVAMFTGSVLHRWHAGDLTFRQVQPVLLGAGATVVLGLAPRLFREDGPGVVGLGRFVPVASAYLIAGAIFLLAMRFASASWPRTLVSLGVISYSIYLVHPLLVELVFPHGTGIVPVVALMASTVAVAAVTYPLVERPAIRVGHRLAKRYR